MGICVYIAVKTIVSWFWDGF